MSMFNDEQRSYMRYLDAQPREKLSWCGWGPAGDPHCCGNTGCEGKKHGLTAADKMKVWCPECHNEPRDGVITHRKGCSRPACPVLCAHCKLRPAACVGAYEDMPEPLETSPDQGKGGSEEPR